MREHSRSDELFDRGRKVIPDGVSSPMRAFAQVDGTPICLRSAQGARVVDVDGNGYVDFLNGFGALILGHAPPSVVAAIQRQAAQGTLYGLSSELEFELAKKIVGSTPALDSIRFVCSGTEAVMTAVRIARSHTGRTLLLKFRGSYHGHSDPLLANPLNVLTLEDGGGGRKGVTRGISAQANREVLLCEYNDERELATAFALHGSSIAAVLVEPHATNMGLVKSRPAFIERLRALCDQHGSLLIFDEVVSGFRLRYGAVCTTFGIDPDLITFGKIIGGGTPVGAYGGRAAYMKQVALDGAVFQSGTFAANPLTMAAGLANLTVLASPGFYDSLESKGAFVESQLRAGFADYGIPYQINRAGSLLGIAFRGNSAPLSDYRDVKTQEYEVFRRFHKRMLDKGFLLPPSLEEPIFISAAHSEEDLRGFAHAACEVLRDLRAQPGRLQHSVA